MNTRKTTVFASIVAIATIVFSFQPAVEKWNSRFVAVGKNGKLTYTPDSAGNIIPDFSRVGFYHGNKEIPVVPVVKTVNATSDDCTKLIQDAINEVAKKPVGENGFRGTVLLKKGTYKIGGAIQIRESGIVLRGEGNSKEGTTLIATDTLKDALIQVNGNGNLREITGTHTPVTDKYVPTGSFTLNVGSAQKFKTGDKILLICHPNDKWIEDIQMNRIVEREGTLQWKAADYDLRYERTITKIFGNTILIDNPVMQSIDAKYGTAEICQYSFEGRLQHVAIENLYCESVYKSDTDESHSWDAISFNKVENSWISKVTARYFSFACVNLGGQAKNITVRDCGNFDAKSVITGSRRYSFSNNGQQNLFVNCHTTEGRHDFVTGARVCGPNVFVNCSAKQTHADIGPHHRWSVGTLYDNIVTDGEINVQDRGNWGSGHGWAGVTQVLWNCTAKRAAVQSPWASGKNYSIGLKGEKYAGRFTGRPDGEWEGQNKEGLEPSSLYYAQLNARKNESTTVIVKPFDLPDPTESFRKSSKVIGWAAGKKPVAPAGFVVTKYADSLNNPRWFYITPNGDVLVSESRTNRRTSPNEIILLRDTDKDGRPDLRTVFMKDLNQPLGMLVLKNWFYVGNTDGVFRYPYAPGQTTINAQGEKILDLPAGGYNNHWTRNLLANADGSKIYVSVGSGSNNGENGMQYEVRRACILEINPDGTGERIFAEGIRNPVGMAWEPVTKKLWTAVNERDHLGDDLVPDYLTSVKEGGFYGWPYAYFGPVEDPRMKGQRPDLVAKTLVPDVPLGAHTASLGLAFYTAKKFPKKYHGGAFVGQHGSWNRSTFSGYKVLFIPFDKNGKPGKPQDFLTGFIASETSNEVYGRPVGVQVLADGSMLVADDAANTIWRVSYK
jgi:glucose/arabinose dehydrogenase